MSLEREPVLIANRGEIAIRVARTCRQLGFPTIAVYSDADRFAEHTRVCDHAYWIGGSEPKDSYLNIDRIIGVAKVARAKYIHPGYGFLSERPEFVRACEKAGLILVGPSAEAMELMGDKISARKTVDQLGVPRVPGSKGALKDAQEAKTVAKKIGYPVLLKASAGGGGKGMRRVDSEKDIEAAYDGASREALAAFGNGALYVEKFILDPHHVEIQVFGDGKGKAVQLGERECSVQRRHQKVLEETPSPLMERYPDARIAMFEAALKITCHLKYAGAGTIEFVTDDQGNFYFLEMNTRLQVEHPVTEWVTGVDLVAWQLLLAAGEFKLPSKPPERQGHSIEVRLYAEDPEKFLPAPGPIGLLDPPMGPFVRWDSAFRGPGEVSVHYDPMIAKISVWGSDRAEAINRMRGALDELRVGPPKRDDGERIGGLKTNRLFLRRLIRNESVISGHTTTDLIAKNAELTSTSDHELTQEAAIALSVFQLISESERQSEGTSFVRESQWKIVSRKNSVHL